jgi:hypothetical protein
MCGFSIFVAGNYFRLRVWGETVLGLAEVRSAGTHHANRVQAKRLRVLNDRNPRLLQRPGGMTDGVGAKMLRGYTLADNPDAVLKSHNQRAYTLLYRPSVPVSVLRQIMPKV